VTVASIDGDPADVLLKESAAASQVVVGNRGLGGFRGLLAGSVSVQTAAHARCPVVVVRPHLPESASPGPERHGVGRIVVGTDCSERSDRAVAFAFAEAQARGIGLTVVHAWRYPVSTSPGELVHVVVNRTDLTDMENDLVAKSFAEHREAHPGVPVQQVLAQGNAAAVLVHESFGADLLVVGSRGHGGFAGLLLGSVSDAAIRHAGCPVAVVR
jgi:nucleotide-binding universal stress UspA family protein